MADPLQPQNSSRSASSGEQPDNDGQQKNATAGPAQSQSDKKKASKLKQIWTKAGLDVMTLSMMVKGSLAPTIAIAMYQSTAVARQYSTLGYLVAITSILGFAIMPRGKFIQAMSLNIISVCLGAAINLLALYTSIQARRHTTPANASPAVAAGYNSSQNVVCAIWLIVQVYLVNYIRAAKPQFQFPAIIYSIFVNVSMLYGPSFPTMTTAISFMERLLEAFLTGFALATGVHFFVFPTSSRKVVFKEMTGYLMCLGGVLRAQTAYMQSLETIDPVALREQRAADENPKVKGKGKLKTEGPLFTPAVPALKGVLGKLLELHTKLNGDITPARREFALGKLESKDISETWKLLRMVFVPVLGLSSMIDILQRRAEQLHWADSGLSDEQTKANKSQIESLHFVFKQLHDPFSRMTAEIAAAFQHVLITLELTKPPKKSKADDEESQSETPKPGSAGFADAYRKALNEFYHSKEVTLQQWAKQKGIELPPDFFEASFTMPENLCKADEHIRERNQRQLFFILYMEYLLYRAGAAVLDLVLFADKLKQEGRFKGHAKLIFPGSKTLYKWLKATFGNEDLSKDDHFLAAMESGSSESVYLGQAFADRKDPEHLPPRNNWEKFGDKIRRIPRFFRSENSAFGFRVAAATMSIAIIGYLRDTRTFFLEQRLLWAMIMVAISMTRTAGQSIFNFTLRVAGTAVAMIGAYIIWYIVVGHAAGVIVFLFIWMACGYYVLLKFPKFIVIGVLSVVTSVLIVGYELQVQKIGIEASESSGQPAYPTYLLGPYRLACVAGGLLVAFFWTMFPYPISENSELRKDLGASLYVLANFYSIVHETVQARVKGTEGDPKVKGTHAYHLDKARNTVFSKLMLLVNGMRTNSAFSKFQIPLGGRFPHAEYENLIECVQRVATYTALIAYASQTFSEANSPAEEKSHWSDDFRRLLTSINATSHQITSTLSLLSSSLTNGQPLPPYMEMPKPFGFLKKIESIDHDILSIRHIAEPEYSAFAVSQICATNVHDDIEELTRLVKTLVGEIDFSYHAVSTTSTSSDASSTDSTGDKGKVE